MTPRGGRGANRAAPGWVPADLVPQLATLVDATPDGPEWLFEIKFDGYRILATLQGGACTLASRTGKDWTAAFPRVARAIEKLPHATLVLDGEVCVAEETGRTDFQSLQHALSEGDQGRLVYFAFDLLIVDGEDLRPLPLIERKARMFEVLRGADPALRGSAHVLAHGRAYYQEACRLGLEGILAKRADRPYVGKRTLDWQKVKCQQRQELTIVGFTPPKGGRRGIGALLVAVKEKDGLRYAGKVGTGFSNKLLVDLHGLLSAIVRNDPPVRGAPRMRVATWVEPRLVAEIRFTEWTREGSLRHPSFLGLREDKTPDETTRERPLRTRARTSTGVAAEKPNAAEEPSATSTPEPHTVSGVPVSSANRVIDRVSGITKLEVARYWEAVADLALPYARDRALALVRCPEGIDGGETFFQKHKTRGMRNDIRVGHMGEDEVIFVRDVAGLVSLAQFNAIELHGWGARMAKPEQPDVLVMDLDPDVGLPWSRIAEAALLLRDRLAELGLTTFVKTTGGKGLHVVVPLAPSGDWELVKAFSEALAKELVRRDPKSFTAKLAKAARAGRIFVDFLRNGRGATAVLPYSPRARPGATIAMPIPWEDVARVDPKAFTVATVPRVLATRRTDPWADYHHVKQRVGRTLAKRLIVASKSQP